MHAALTLDEVVDQIVAYLPPRDVLAVARVCKAFFDVAIDVYWDNKIVAFHSLLNMLPMSQHKPLTFSRALDSETLGHMLKVAPRVRNISLRYWPPIDHRVFDTLSDRTSYAFKLPVSNRLRRLDWRISAQSHVRMFISLLGPSVRDIAVSFPNTESTTFDLVGMFGAIRALCPHTRNLNVSILYPSNTFVDAFVQCIRTLDLSQAVLQFNLSASVLRVLAGLPNLAWLDCECHSDLGNWEPPAPARLFPSLRRLRVNGYHPAYMSILESVARPYALESLQLNIGDGLEHTLSQTLSLIGATSPHLHTLVLRTHTGLLKTTHKPDIALVSSVSSGLLQCTLLETLHIVYPYALQWDDADLTRLARAFPRLRSLRLNAYPGLRPTEPRATLEAVHAFSKYCPQLFELELFLLVRLSPEATTLAPHTALRFLDFGKSQFSEGTQGEDVARSLVRMFPSLEELRSAEPDTSEEGCMWENPEITHSRSAVWDAVRSTYSSERRSTTAQPQSRALLLPAHIPSREPEPTPTPPIPHNHGAMFDTVPAWPFA